MPRSHLLFVAILAVAGCDLQPSPPSDAESSRTPSVVGLQAVHVPDVRERALGDAVSSLRDEGLKVEVVRRFSRDNAGDVLAQVPTSGSEVVIGSTVKVFVAHPLPKVPDVVGERLPIAERTLSKADFRVAKIFGTRTTRRDGVVVSQSPPSGTRTRPERVVRVTVSTKRCTPGYSTCFSPGPDVDCFGGRGMGPRFTDALGLLVRGNDPYRLDVDGDGIGCELP